MPSSTVHTEHLAGYRVVERLHTGQRFEVFRAQRASDGRSVIVKTSRQQTPSPRDLDMLRREHEIGHSIADPHVIEYLALSPYRHGVFLVTEDFGGVALAELIPQEGMDLAMFARIAQELVRGLGVIHQHEVIHKDINPRNIVCNRDTGVVKYIDFSIASRFDASDQQTLDPNRVEGTLAYLAPEQSGRLGSALDHRADFYSLGATFYHMLSGRPPFDSSDPMELIHCHLASTPITPKELAPAIPEILSDIVMKLLEKDASARYQSSYGLLADLQRCLSAPDTEPEAGQPLNKPLFALGQDDAPIVLELPGSRYGQESARQTLLSTYRALEPGHRAAMILVQGDPGVGKSSLVQETLRRAAAERGYFAHGQVTAGQSGSPQIALSNALRDLVRQILTSSDSELKAWREKIIGAVGSSISVLFDVVPELQAVVGTRPVAPELGALEARHRFYSAVKSFVALFCKPGAPLVIFLDDLQWADDASFDSIAALLDDDGPHGLVLVAAVRQDEISEHRALQETLDTLDAAGRIAARVQLEPLALAHVAELLADTLHESRDRVKLLAELAHKKTRGNPLFLRQLLTSLYRDKILRFHEGPAQSRGWRWQLDEIAAQNLSSDVDDLIGQELAELPPDTRGALAMAACIGNRFAMATLAAAAELSAEEVERALAPAVREGLVFASASEPKASGESAERTGRFVHERVYRAVYDAIEDSERKRYHLRIGRALLDQSGDGTSSQERTTSPSELEVVTHFGRAQEILGEYEDQLRVAKLALSAGHKALASTAYRSATEYFEIGIRAAGEDWGGQRALLLALHLGKARGAFLSGQDDLAESVLNELLDRDLGSIDTARVCAERVSLLNIHRRSKEAADHALRGLRACGVDIARYPSKLAVRSHLLRAKWTFRSSFTDTLLALPNISDSAQELVMELLHELATAAYVLDSDLMTVVHVRHALGVAQSGFHATAATALVKLGMIMGSRLGDHMSAEQLALAGLALGERRGERRYQPRAKATAQSFVLHWCRPYSECRLALGDCDKEALEVGDLETASIALASINDLRAIVGTNLEVVEKEARRSEEIISRYGHAVTILVARAGFAAGLLSGTHTLDPNSPDPLDLALTDHIPVPMPRYSALVHGLCPLVIMGHFEKAFELADSIAGDVEQVLFATPLVAEHTLYYGLAAAGTMPFCQPRERRRRRRIATECHRKMRRWASFCAGNFEHKERLLAAEIERAKGHSIRAMARYEEAVQSCREHGFPHLEALGTERLAAVLVDEEWGHMARERLEQSYELYAAWGAKAKVAALARQHPQLLARPASRRRRASNQSTGPGPAFTTSDALDLSTLMKASEAISREIRIDDLLQRLIALIIENTGAERGALVVDHDGELIVEIMGAIAGATSNESDAESPSLAQEPVPLAECQHLATSTVRYASRTQEVVLWHAADGQHRFDNDAYVVKAKPKAILCFPVMYQDDLFGVIYLENTLASHAFADEQLEVLRLLSGQIAISITNARYYAHLENMVVERTEALRAAKQQAETANAAKSRFLARMSHDLRAPLNGILGYTQIIRMDETLTAEQLEGLDIIDESGHHLLGMINELLDLAKIEAGKTELNAEPIDLPRLLSGVAAVIRTRANDKGIELLCEIAEDLPASVEADPQRLRQVLLNLLSNAVKFTDAGQVMLRVSLLESDAGFIAATKSEPAPSADEIVRFEVIDTGIGIPADRIETIFEPFEQERDTGDRAHGTGLGLTICRQLVELMNGDLQAESTSGEGSRFWFDIPLPLAEPE